MTGVKAAPAIALVLMLMCGAGAIGEEETPGWAIGAYVSVEGNLIQAGARYATSLVRFAQATGTPLALQLDAAQSEAGAVRIIVRGETSRIETLQPAPHMGEIASVAAFARWMEAEVAARRRALVVFGHGLSPGGVEGEGSSYPAPALMLDTERQDALTARELAAGLLEASLKADVIVLDCCFGATLDVLWELRAAGEIVLASPGRRPTDGVPWAAVAKTEIAGAASGEEFARQMLAATRGFSRCPEGMTAVRGERVAGLVAAVAELSRMLAQDENYVPALATARRKCLEWGYQRELCDLRQLAVMFAATGMAGAHKASEQVATAVAECVVDRVGLPVEVGGIAVVLPGGRWRPPKDYGVDETGFAAVSGWREVVRRYCRWQQDLIRGKNDGSGLG